MATAMVTILLSLAIGIVLCVIVFWRGLVALLNKFNDRNR